jgi:hypothetical protein
LKICFFPNYDSNQIVFSKFVIRNLLISWYQTFPTENKREALFKFSVSFDNISFIKKILITNFYYMLIFVWIKKTYYWKHSCFSEKSSLFIFLLCGILVVELLNNFCINAITSSNILIKQICVVFSARDFRLNAWNSLEVAIYKHITRVFGLLK